MLEGGFGCRPQNALIYATSIAAICCGKVFRSGGDEIHLGDTIQESMSLADRFGLSIQFSLPDKVHFLDCGAFGTPARAGRIPPRDQGGGRNAGRSPAVAVHRAAQTIYRRRGSAHPAWTAARLTQDGRETSLMLKRSFAALLGVLLMIGACLGCGPQGDISSGVAERTFSYRQ